jgi:hypothetical protein
MVVPVLSFLLFILGFVREEAYRKCGEILSFAQADSFIS